MIYRLLADLLVLLHLAFILFVVFGGFLVLRWRRIAWVHLPVAAYGFSIAVFRWVCPLTPLEVWLRRQGGQAGYAGSFVDQYVVPVVYPPGLTPTLEMMMAAGVLVANALAYGLVVGRRLRRSKNPPE